MDEQKDARALALVLVKHGEFLALQNNETVALRSMRHKSQLMGTLFASTALRNMALWGMGVLRERVKDDATLYDIETTGKEKAHSARTIAGWLSKDSEIKVSYATVERGTFLHSKYTESDVRRFCGLSSRVLYEAGVLPTKERNELLEILMQDELTEAIAPGEIIDHVRAAVAESKTVKDATEKEQAEQRKAPVTSTRTQAEKTIASLRVLMGGVDEGRWVLSGDDAATVKGIVDALIDTATEAKVRLL